MRTNVAEKPVFADVPFEVIEPESHYRPFVFASPHSGTNYPADFVAASPLDLKALRRSEDSFVDELFAAAPGLGVPLIRALFPRVFCDVNREPYELDPGMFEDDLPEFANTTSLRVAGGLGVIARIVDHGCEVYRRKLTYAEAERRIEHFYRPYHAALGDTLAATLANFGCAVLIDCHSMPSISRGRDRRQVRPDIILGDRFGRSCAGGLTQMAQDILVDMGYRVGRNNPYAGGFTTIQYGQPERQVHALQIEINRALYMDEDEIERLPGIHAVAADMAHLIDQLTAVPVEALLGR